MARTWADIQHFSPAEFRCRCGVCGSDGQEMDIEFVFKLDRLRGLLGFPFKVSSGYRCPAHNEQVSSTGRDGPHTTGHAADILVHGGQVHELMHHAAWSMTGIGLNQRGAIESRFIHLDDLKIPGRPWVWTY